MLEEVRRSYLNQASRIKGWQKANKNDLINACIDCEDDDVRYEAYFSAIVLRYWGNIGKYYSKSKFSGFSIEDCYGWLLDAITYILKKRKWRDPNSSLFNDKCGPDKCMNRCIYSSRQQHYYTSNLDKHKANYSSISLEGLTDQVGDHTDFIADDSTHSCNPLNNLDIIMLLQRYVKQDKILSSIVLYSLTAEDCFSEKTLTKKEGNEKYKTRSSEFKLSKLVNCIYKCTEGKVENMATNLDLDKEEYTKLKKSYEKLQGITKNRVGTIVRKTIENLSNDPSLRSYLCC